MSVTIAAKPSEAVGPGQAAALLADWGFLAESDLPDRPGPAWLLVALRPVPTLRHFDPEIVEYWVTDDGRGRPAVLTHADHMPLERDFSWGMIRIVDRLGISNEYLAFGGHLSAARIDGATYAVFRSPVPLLCRGGHSQGWDPAAEPLGAFLGRLKIAVDYIPGFEARLAAAGPVARYALFVVDATSRFRGSRALRDVHPSLSALMTSEEQRLEREYPIDLAAGAALLAEAGM
jgi:hypothetical protein